MRVISLTPMEMEWLMWPKLSTGMTRIIMQVFLLSILLPNLFPKFQSPSPLTMMLKSYSTSQVFESNGITINRKTVTRGIHWHWRMAPSSFITGDMVGIMPKCFTLTSSCKELKFYGEDFRNITPKMVPLFNIPNGLRSIFLNTPYLRKIMNWQRMTTKFPSASTISRTMKRIDI